MRRHTGGQFQPWQITHPPLKDNKSSIMLGEVIIYAACLAIIASAWWWMVAQL